MVVARFLEARVRTPEPIPAYLADLVSDRRCTPHEARGIVYRALVRCANRGAPCPTGEQLAAMVGYETGHGTVELLKRLERIGLIKVSRHQRSRQVTIINTGKKTRPCVNTTPHWRDQRSIQAQAEGV